MAAKLEGTLRLSDESGRRTAGMFSKLINDNAKVFERYFGVRIFPGSLNVDVPQPVALQAELDAGLPTPTIVIPRSELINMPSYLGNGQAWPIVLTGAKFQQPVSCWIFRRVGSQVPRGVIEIIAAEALRTKYDLKHGDAIAIEFSLKTG
jgi:CTP-dependent riboflavin kinase